MGRMSDAISENQRALQPDPLSLPINNFMGMTFMFAGDYEKADRQFQHTIAMDPTFPLAHEYFSIFLEAIGRYQEAVQESEKSELLAGASPEAAAAQAAVKLQAFKKGGELRFWHKNLELTLQSLQERKGEFVAAGDFAAYALVGDKDKAFHWLDKVHAERDREGYLTAAYLREVIAGLVLDACYGSRTSEVEGRKRIKRRGGKRSAGGCWNHFLIALLCTFRVKSWAPVFYRSCQLRFPDKLGGCHGRGETSSRRRARVRVALGPMPPIRSRTQTYQPM